MIDLDRQIREYYDRIVIPVTTDEYARLATGRPVPAGRSRAWAMAVAFVVALVGVGVTMLMLGGNGTSFIDQPEPLPTPVTHQSSSTITGTVSVPPGWQQVAAGEPWVEHIVDLEAIPGGGGFVIRAADPWSVYWSPDGVEWSDVDPNRQISPYQAEPVDGPKTGAQVIAASSDRVVVLDRPNTGLWVGDPQDGIWEQILLGTDDLAGDVELLAVTSNGEELLVLALVYGPARLEDRTVDPGDQPSPIPGIDQYLVWVLDPTNGTVERHSLPIAAHWGGVVDTVVEWFNGHWVIYLEREIHEWPEGAAEEESLLVSSDGVSWTNTAPPPDWGRSLTSLTAGSTTMIATVCHFGGDSFWHSEDGLNWTQTTSSLIGHHSTYSDDLGFVVVYEGDMLVSPDGQSWHRRADTPASGVAFLAASGNRVLVGDGLRPEESPGLWLWTSE
jgi:hypothetical protein